MPWAVIASATSRDGRARTLSTAAAYPTSASAASGATTPSRSLSANTPRTRCRRSHVKKSGNASASARPPAGLCAPSRTTSGRCADDLQAPGRRRRAERQPDGVRSRARSSSASTATTAAAALCAAYSPKIGRQDVLVGRVEPADREGLPARRPASDRRPPSRDPRAAAWRSDLVASPLDAPRAPRPSCSRTTATLPCLMMPAFSRATSAIVEPSSRMVEPDRA